MNENTKNKQNDENQDDFKGNKLEAASLLLEIKNTIKSVNVINLLSQLTIMGFYVGEDEDVHERNISYTLRDLPIIHLINGLCLQIHDDTNKPDIKAKDLYELIKKAKSYLFIDNSYTNVLNNEYKDRQLVIYGHKQTMRMTRPLNPERYQHQTVDFINHINDKVSDIFSNKFGITPNLFITIGTAISEFTINKVNNISKTTHLHPLVKQFINNPSQDSEFVDYMEQLADEEQEDFSDFYVRHLIELQTREALLFTSQDLKKDAIFENIEGNQIDKYLLLYSSKKGDQLIDSDVLIDNVLLSRPLINWNGLYFCPAPSDIISVLPSFFEKLLEQDRLSTPPTRFWDRYQKAKGHFVEDKAEEFFLRIFPKNTVYKNVIFVTNGNIEEADILIPYDNKLIIVQAKSGSLNSAARRGAEKSSTQAVKKLLEDSYQQGVKVRNYLKSNSNAVFKLRSNNSFAFAKNSESNLTTDYIFISLTLEPLGRLSARIKDLSNLGFFKDNEYPISMSIYDLDTITTFLPKSPSILLHYVKQRINAQNDGTYIFQDELTPFSSYLETGSLRIPSDQEFDDATHINIDPDYLIKFDDYYLRKKDKPKLMIEDEWVKLIQHIEYKATPQHTEITDQLLNIIPEMQEIIIERIKTAFNKSRKKEVTGVVTLASVDAEIGISFITKDSTTRELNNSLKTYCLLKKYEAKKRPWIGLAKQKKSNGYWWNVTCVQYYNFSWKFDLHMENLSNKFSSNS